MHIDADLLLTYGFVLAIIFMGMLFKFLNEGRHRPGWRERWRDHWRERVRNHWSWGEPARPATPTPDEREMEERMMRLLDRMEQRITNLESILMDCDRGASATERR